MHVKDILEQPRNCTCRQVEKRLVERSTFRGPGLPSARHRFWRHSVAMGQWMATNQGAQRTRYASDPTRSILVRVGTQRSYSPARRLKTSTSTWQWPAHGNGREANDRTRKCKASSLNRHYLLCAAPAVVKRMKLSPVCVYEPVEHCSLRNNNVRQFLHARTRIVPYSYESHRLRTDSFVRMFTQRHELAQISCLQIFYSLLNELFYSSVFNMKKATKWTVAFVDSKPAHFKEPSMK